VIKKLKVLTRHNNSLCKTLWMLLVVKVARWVAVAWPEVVEEAEDAEKVRWAEEEVKHQLNHHKLLQLNSPTTSIGCHLALSQTPTIFEQK
jgi:hypothetical protein